MPAPAPIVLRVPSNDMSAGYVAVLSDPKTEKPVIFVSAGRDSNELWVRTLDASIRVPDMSLELWALPASGAPKSLGLVSGEEKGTLKLASAAETSLAEVPRLAVSLEPKGGSPTGAPTGPVLFTGRLSPSPAELGFGSRKTVVLEWMDPLRRTWRPVVNVRATRVQLLS